MKGKRNDTRRKRGNSKKFKAGRNYGNRKTVQFFFFFLSFFRSFSVFLYASFTRETFAPKAKRAHAIVEEDKEYKRPFYFSLFQGRFSLYYHLL